MRNAIGPLFFLFLYFNFNIMRSIIAVFLFLLLASFTGGDNPITPECTCKSIPLYGKVKIVTQFPDFKVRVTESFPDLEVKVVDAFPDQCGEWQFVDDFPDFKIQFVNNFEDFSIKFVDAFPGRK